MMNLIVVALFQAAGGPPAPVAPALPSVQNNTVGGEQATPGGDQAASPEPLRCRRELITGTRLSRRVCTTAREDQVIADESRDMLTRATTQMPLQGN